MQRAVSSVPSSSNSFPSMSWARTMARRLRCTLKKIPGKERQPSSPSCLPSIPTTSGLIITMRCAGSLPAEQSITNRRLGTPTCTAARPTPGAEYIVSNILLTSFFRSPSNVVTGSPGSSRIGFGQVTIFSKDILESQIRFFRHLNFTVNVLVSLVRIILLCWLLVTAQLLSIAFKVPLHLAQAVAAKLLSHCRGQHQRDHRFANHAAGGNDRDVRTFESSPLFLLRIDINRAQRAPQRRDRFQVAAHAQLFAVGDAAFQSAGPIAGANKFLRLFVITNLVVNFRAGQGTDRSTSADRDRLHCGDRHHRLRQTSVKF